MENNIQKSSYAHIFPSIDDTGILKSIFSICVLIHHIYQEIRIFPNMFIDNILLSLGYLSVSMFLFLSGYGLSLSTKNHGYKYINNLPKNRIAPFYLQIVILNTIYFFINWLIDGKPNISGFVHSFSLSSHLIRNGWYLVVGLFTYIIFYFIYTLFKNNYFRIILIGALLALFAVTSIKIFNYGTWWYESNYAFLAGVIFGGFYKSDLRISRRLYNILLSFYIGIFAISYYLVQTRDFGFTVNMIIKAVSSISFPLTICLLKNKLNKKLSYIHNLLINISKISFEIYVSQGIFLSLFHSKRFLIENSILYTITVVFSTFFFSIILNVLFKKINTMFKTC